MSGSVVQDRYSRGLGAAARALGDAYDVFRPCGVFEPMAAERVVLRLAAAFDLGDPGYRRPKGYERGLRGTFDVVCTGVGDYLRGPKGVLFIAMLPRLQRPLCVLTNATLDVLRPGGAEGTGLAPYGGVQERSLRTVLRGWPAQVLGGAAGQAASGGASGLPNDGGRAGWEVLLPPTPEPIMGSDVVRDEAGRRYLVRVAECSEAGWRLQVRQAGV